MKKIKIGTLRKSKKGDKIIISFEISNEFSDREILWYEIDDKYDEFICYDRCDGILVNIILSAMKFEYEEIECSMPVSEKLYYNLTYHMIPQIYEAEGRKIPKIIINCKTVNKTYDSFAVAAGMSRGVDSFFTMYEYGEMCNMKNYSITHFTYFNVGAHHGRDLVLGESKYTKRELYEGQLEKTKEFCKKYNYKLITVDSNLYDVLNSEKLFGKWSFDRSHTFRNLGIGLLLQKGINKYYYSAAYDLRYFELNLNSDSAKYEKWAMRHLCTENIEFYSSNQNLSRLEKIKKIVELEESYDFLNVCLLDIENCGVCSKCQKTLMELDVLGDGYLERYKNSFDLNKYKSIYRNKWFSKIYELKDTKGIYGSDYKEIFDLALKTRGELVGKPLLESETNGRTYHVFLKNAYSEIRSLPSANVPVIRNMNEKRIFIYVGKISNWIGIIVDKNTIGYIENSLVRICEYREAEKELYAYIKSKSLNIREFPDLEAKVVEKTAKHYIYKILAYYDDNWVAVETGNDIGYCHVSGIKEFTIDNSFSFQNICYGKVKCKSLNIRSLPGINADDIGIAYEGYVYKILNYYDDWAEIELDNNIGYCHISGIEGTEYIEECKQCYVFIKKENVKLYKFARISDNIICEVDKFSTYRILGYLSDWIEIEINGERGFINSEYADKCYCITKLQVEMKIKRILHKLCTGQRAFQSLCKLRKLM